MSAELPQMDNRGIAKHKTDSNMHLCIKELLCLAHCGLLCSNGRALIALDRSVL